METNTENIHQQVIVSHLPAVLAWLQSEGHALDEVLHVKVGQNVQIRPKERGNTSQWQEYEPTGTYPVDLTLTDGSTMHRVFLRSDLFPHADTP